MFYSLDYIRSQGELLLVEQEHVTDNIKLTPQRLEELLEAWAKDYDETGARGKLARPARANLAADNFPTVDTVGKWKAKSEEERHIQEEATLNKEVQELREIWDIAQQQRIVPDVPTSQILAYEQLCFCLLYTSDAADE